MWAVIEPRCTISTGPPPATTHFTHSSSEGAILEGTHRVIREGSGYPFGRFRFSLHFFDVFLDTHLVEFLVFFNHVRVDIAPLYDLGALFQVVDMVCLKLNVSTVYSTCHVCALYV